MVNPVTGDFTYNLPMLNVPGPNGGYSMSLFYHGGIKVDQVASWMGLGWNMNPGAINRAVIGVPDDWKGKKSLALSYANLGTFTRNYLNVTWGGPVGASIGFDWGNNKSFGLASLGTNFILASGTVNMSGSSSFSVGGFDPIAFFSGSGGSGNPYLRTNLKSFGFPIPTPIGLTLNYQYSKAKYFIAMDQHKYNYGILHASEGYFENENPGLQDYEYLMDSYANPYDVSTFDNDEYEFSNNLSFPAYDQFQVNAQGLSGVFSAKGFQHATLPRNSNFEGEKWMTYVNKSPSTLPKEDIHFQFNSQIASSPWIGLTGWDIDVNATDRNPINAVTAQGLSSTVKGVYYNATRNKAGTPQPIEWLTNDEIVNDPTSVAEKGLMDFKSILGDRLDVERSDPDGIGAIVITTETGHTYHFCLAKLSIRNH